MNDPDLIARWEPHRAARRPSKVPREAGFTGPCWVRDPYIATLGHSNPTTCVGCRGIPTSIKPPLEADIALYGGFGAPIPC